MCPCVPEQKSQHFLLPDWFCEVAFALYRFQPTPLLLLGVAAAIPCLMVKDEPKQMVVPPTLPPLSCSREKGRFIWPKTD